jgi:hypothetical protein
LPVNVHGGEAYEPVRDAEEAASPFFVVFVFVFVSVSERPGSMLADAWRAGRLDAGGVEVVDADREACHRGEENVRAIATGRIDRLIFLVERSRSVRSELPTSGGEGLKPQTQNARLCCELVLLDVVGGRVDDELTRLGSSSSSNSLSRGEREPFT